jgi:hypothetical protein
MFFNLLHDGKKGMVKNKRDLDKNGNIFGCSHLINKNHTAWCLPFFDRLTNKLSFIVWNMEGPDEIEVSLIYNNDRYINLGKIGHMNWRMEEIGNYSDSKNLIVILNGKIRNTYNFDESFKEISYREIKER